MENLNISSCKECKFHLKVTHEYCYHPKKYGTMLENSSIIPAWCPLKKEKAP